MNMSMSHGKHIEWRRLGKSWTGLRAARQGTGQVEFALLRLEVEPCLVSGSSRAFGKIELEGAVKFRLTRRQPCDTSTKVERRNVETLERWNVGTCQGGTAWRVKFWHHSESLHAFALAVSLVVLLFTASALAYILAQATNDRTAVENAGRNFHGCIMSEAAMVPWRVVRGRGSACARSSGVSNERYAHRLRLPFKLRIRPPSPTRVTVVAVEEASKRAGPTDADGSSIAP